MNHTKHFWSPSKVGSNFHTGDLEGSQEKLWFIPRSWVLNLFGKYLSRYKNMRWRRPITLGSQILRISGNSTFTQ